jgi:hypothetical protein
VTLKYLIIAAKSSEARGSHEKTINYLKAALSICEKGALLYEFNDPREDLIADWKMKLTIIYAKAGYFKESEELKSSINGHHAIRSKGVELEGRKLTFGKSNGGSFSFKDNGGKQGSFKEHKRAGTGRSSTGLVERRSAVALDSHRRGQLEGIMKKKTLSSVGACTIC